MSFDTSDSQKEHENQNKIDFIDRDTYQTLIKNGYREILKQPAKFKIIFLHGPGGFGKTSLLKKCLKEMNDPKAKPIYVPLEIASKDDKLDILIKFRKALPKKHFYPLFDYAMQFLWNSLNTSKIDDEFLSFTRSSLCQFIKSGADVAVTAATTAAAVPVGIAPASFVDILSAGYNKLKKTYNKYSSNKLDDIENMQSHDLINKLPEYLGIDVHRAFLEETLVFVIDSYQEYSNNLVDPSGWLTTLVQNIKYGLFVITSRENITWPDDIKSNVVSKKLDELPKEEVYKELDKRFKSYPQLIENIISVTDCIPIYLDLAVSSLDADNLEGQSCNLFYFKNKEDIVHKFLIHLPENEREAITTLAIVQIFNKEVFEFLVNDLHLLVSYLSFEEICKRSLIRNVEHDNCFYKTHTIISENLSRITDKNTVQRILKSYITVIRNRVLYSYTNIQINMLFKHIISLIIRNELSLQEEDAEKLLDIYFVIKESLLPFECDDIQGFDSYQPLSHIYYFLKALSEERKDSNVRLNWLNKIENDSKKFGKHIKSYQLMRGYLRALCESCQWLKTIVNKLNLSLTNSEKQEWYYGQTKIFFGDCNISYGNFKTGIQELQSYKRLLPALVGKENDAFQITRHIAHGYRFNMLLEKAETSYRSLIEGEGILPTPLQKVYILTNLCETCCYFKPGEVLKIKDEALSFADKFNDLKSKGKICYSLAIVYLIQRKYELAKKYICDSILYNQQDGYVAGQLYAYMARAYYEYARYGIVSDFTLSKIRNIQKDIQVYGYFSLPLAMMQKEYSDLNQIRKEYEWLDFDKTALSYRRFLDSIRIPED